MNCESKESIVKRTTLIAAAVFAACATLQAQAPAQAPPPAADAQAAAPALPPPTAEQRRRDVKYMEGILAGAVRSGAEDLGRRMQIAEPNSLIVTGSARARGIALDGYGVFFDVDVPMMKQSVLWTTRQLMLQDLREKVQELNQIIATTQDPDQRRIAAAQLRVLNATLQGSMLAAQSQGNALLLPESRSNTLAVTNGPPPGTVSAANESEAPAPVLETRDANELYTEAVKTSLIDAMLNYSRALYLGEDEWLTVAARDSEGPITPGAIDDASTIVIRIKGRDLSAFHANKITREEILRRVEVKEF